MRHSWILIKNLVDFLGQFLAGHRLGNHRDKSGRCRFSGSLLHIKISRGLPELFLIGGSLCGIWCPLNCDVPRLLLLLPSTTHLLGFTADFTNICKSVKFAHDFFTKDTVSKRVFRFLARASQYSRRWWKCFPESQEIFGTRLDDDGSVQWLDD